jgi:hypothetical protein
MYRGIFGNRGARCTAVIGVALASLLWVGSSQAKMVTVGPALPMPVDEGIIYGCEESCVMTNTGPVDGSSDVSPVDGAILRWHVYQAMPYGYFRLRVLSRRGQSQEYVGAGRSDQALTVREGVVETFSARLPIKAGQMIGLELENGQASTLAGYSPAADPVLLEPAMPDGAIGSPPSWWSEGVWGTGLVFPFNAEILPAPTISGVNAIQGPPAGGNQVTITGENFAEVSSVNFGSTAASYAVRSESELIATVPAGLPASSVPVSVVTVAGQAQAPAAYGYESLPTDSAPVAGQRCVVPKLKAERLAAVRRSLSRDGCRLGRVGKRDRATAHSGRVKKQSPPPGATLPPGGRVNVTLGMARPRVGNLTK